MMIKKIVYILQVFIAKSYKIMEHYVNQMIDNKDHINSSVIKVFIQLHG